MARRGPPASLITLSALAFAGLVVTLITVAISSVVATSLAGAAPAAAGVTPITWSDAFTALVKGWASVLPYVALVTFPICFPSARTASPRAGTRSPSARNPTRRRFMCPWYVARAITSWPS